MFQDLINSLKTAGDDVLLRDTLLYTLRCTSATGGHKISDATKKSVLACLWNYIGSCEYHKEFGYMTFFSTFINKINFL